MQELLNRDYLYPDRSQPPNILVLAVGCWVCVPLVQKATSVHLHILSTAAAWSTHLSSSTVLKMLSFIFRCSWHHSCPVVAVISQSTAFLWQCPIVHLGVRNVYPGPTSHREIIPSRLFPSDHVCVTAFFYSAEAMWQLKTSTAWAGGAGGMKVTHCHKFCPESCF